MVLFDKMTGGTQDKKEEKGYWHLCDKYLCTRMFRSLFRQRVYDCGINVNWFRAELPHIFEPFISYLYIKYMTMISALNSARIYCSSRQIVWILATFLSWCVIRIFWFVPHYTAEEIRSNRNVYISLFWCWQACFISDHWNSAICLMYIDISSRPDKNASNSCQATAVDLEWWHKEIKRAHRRKRWREHLNLRGKK